jgi:hypothetical protein
MSSPSSSIPSGSLSAAYAPGQPSVEQIVGADDVAVEELVVMPPLVSATSDNAGDFRPVQPGQYGHATGQHLGGNTFQFFTDNLQACTLSALQLENQLRKVGINEGQLDVFYQPKLCLDSDSITPRLMRWRQSTERVLRRRTDLSG